MELSTVTRTNCARMTCDMIGLSFFLRNRWIGCKVEDWGEVNTMVKISNLVVGSVSCMLAILVIPTTLFAE